MHSQHTLSYTGMPSSHCQQKERALNGILGWTCSETHVLGLKQATSPKAAWQRSLPFRSHRKGSVFIWFHMLCSYFSKDWDNFCCFLITFSEGSGLFHAAVLGIMAFWWQPANY